MDAVSPYCSGITYLFSFVTVLKGKPIWLANVFPIYVFLEYNKIIVHEWGY